MEGEIYLAHCGYKPLLDSRVGGGEIKQNSNEESAAVTK